MKKYTDIEQSKKIAEILPIKSADMKWFIPSDNEGEFIEDASFIKYESEYYLFEKITDWNDTPYVPCWSLTALLDVLPVSCDDGQHCFALINPNPNDKTEWLCAYEDCKGDLIMECYADNSVDACYEMILKLHELKML